MWYRSRPQTPLSLQNLFSMINHPSVLPCNIKTMQLFRPSLILYSLLFTILFAGCSDPETFVVTGQLVEGCDQVPISSQEIELFQIDNGTIATSTTDSEGRFSFAYSEDRLSGNEKISLGIVGSLQSLRFVSTVPANDDAGTLILAPTVDIILSLNVSNPYTEKDTLFYTDYRLQNGSLAKLTGPFQSSVIDTALNVVAESSIRYIWFINENTPENNNNRRFDVNGCAMNTVTLDIE